MSGRVHPSAIIDSGASLGRDVEIGPFAIIGPSVIIGDGCRIEARATLERNVRLGAGVSRWHRHRARWRPAGPQVRREETWVEIGERTRIREYAPSIAAPGRPVRPPSVGRRVLMSLCAPGPRLSRWRRRHHRQRHPARRPRDGARSGDPLRTGRGAPVREHRLDGVHRRLQPGQPGYPALREGSGEFRSSSTGSTPSDSAGRTIRPRRCRRSSAPTASSSIPISTSRRRRNAPARMPSLPEVDLLLEFVASSSRGIPA